MTDSEFLDDLESRIYDTWSEEETLRLWKLNYYRIPPAHIRAAYAYDRGRRYEHIDGARKRAVGKVIERLDQ